MLGQANAGDLTETVAKPCTCHNEPDDRFSVFDLAASDQFERIGKRIAFDGKNFVFFKVLLRLGEVGREKEEHLFGQEARRDIEFDKFFDAASADADLFFELADRTCFRVLVLVQSSGWYLQ